MNTVDCDIFSLFFDRLLFPDGLKKLRHFLFVSFRINNINTQRSGAINFAIFQGKNKRKKEAKERRRKDQDVF